MLVIHSHLYDFNLELISDYSFCTTDHAIAARHSFFMMCRGNSSTDE